MRGKLPSSLIYRNFLHCLQGNAAERGDPFASESPKKDILARFSLMVRCLLKLLATLCVRSAIFVFWCRLKHGE
jgi:hypothetical protein